MLGVVPRVLGVAPRVLEVAPRVLGVVPRVLGVGMRMAAGLWAYRIHDGGDRKGPLRARNRQVREAGRHPEPLRRAQQVGDPPRGLGGGHAPRRPCMPRCDPQGAHEVVAAGWCAGYWGCYPGYEG